jgi:5-methylcytosine-specific restriction endonuclease McrA
MSFGKTKGRLRSVSDFRPCPKPGKPNRRGLRDGRLILSPAKRTAQRKRLWDERQHLCAICKKVIWVISDMELDHAKPKKMGGSERDDSDQNQRLTHIWCNRESISLQEGGNNG